MNEEIRASREAAILKAQKALDELEIGTPKYESAVKAIKTLNDALNDDVKAENETRKIESEYVTEEVPTTFFGKVKYVGKKAIRVVGTVVKFTMPILAPVASAVIVKGMDCDQHERDNEHERGLARDCMDFENEKTFTTMPSKKLIFKSRH